MAVAALQDEVNLARHRVDGVYDIIVVHREEAVRLVGQVEVIDRVDDCLRIDVENALFHRLRLLLADGLRGRMNLAVDVRQADEVIVDEDEMADTSARKPFGYEGADPADAKDGHRALCQLLHARLAEQQLCAGKTT